MPLLERIAFHGGSTQRVDDPFSRERKGAADRRMAGHRQFLARREDPHPDIAARSRWEDERALGEVHFARDGLHHLRRDRSRLGKDGELIAFQRAVGEHVEVQIAHGVHDSRVLAFRQGAFEQWPRGSTCLLPFTILVFVSVQRRPRDSEWR